MPAMIFAFVVLIAVSSLSYLVRYNLLSIKSLQSQEIASTVEQQYIQEISQKGTIATGDTSFGSYHIQNILQLNSSGHISDTERGYIGFLKKEYDWLLISVNKNIQIINLKNLDLSENYSLKIGWQLSKGSWQMLLAIYDKQHLYIFKTKLTNLVNNLSKAVLDFINTNQSD
ncbi:hypothetical protein [Francisella orientalis]|uniref:hypothetical protein n=1 Tax=Francisella orientalis TaxID=299583 RepID=UPI00031E2C54|nr:hypothetical protein [Francisella orientalis]